MKQITFTRHAEERLEARGISKENIERILGGPDWTEPDPVDASLTRAYGPLEARRGQMLRVVFRAIDERRLVVVTAHVDGTATRRKPR